MKVTVAVDSFKGSLSSMEAGNAVKSGILRVVPNAQVKVKPLADGGEGTVEALVSGMGGIMQQISVTGPLGTPVTCEYGILDGMQERTAILEMAGAAGITLVPKEKRDPFYTTTYGVGEVIKDAIGKGCRKFIIGIGGSATNDGGVGMLQALGYSFRDEAGEEIPLGAAGLEHLASISDEKVLWQLRECSFRIACDVTNPLCGEFGCSAVFGPQKGAAPEQIAQMDGWLANYAKLARGMETEIETDVETDIETDIQGSKISEYDRKKADPDWPGAGAAGGLGFAFRAFTNAVLESGIKIVLEETRLEQEIPDADLVITGEGRLDGQTVMGKAPSGVAEIAKKYGKAVVAFSGCVSEDAFVCNEHGIDAYFPILRNVVSLEEAMEPENARKNLSDTAEQMMRLWQAARDF